MSNNPRPVVGFVGLGDQGLPIAQAIADKGYSLHVWARRPQSLDGLKGFDHVAENSVEALAQASDIVGLCLREDSDNLQIATEGGLLAAMKRGGILVNHGTGLPEQARLLAELAEPYGITVVDAPVSGGHAVAVARQLTTIAGGPTEAIARLTPIFETFSKRVIHVGPTGAGQYGKVFNNALMMMNHKNLSDVLALAKELNLPLAPLIEVLRSGSASSVALMAFGPSITTANASHLQTLELLDMDLFAATVTSLGDAATSVVGRAVAGAQGLPALTTLIEEADAAVSGEQPGGVTLSTSDPAVAAAFYAKVLGWEIAWHNGIAHASINGRPAAQIAAAHEGQSGWLTHVVVANIQATLKAIEQAGGTVLARPGGEAPLTAVVTDSARTRFAVTQLGAGHNAGRLEEPGGFTWSELITDDVQASGDFYRAVFGWTLTDPAGPLQRRQWQLAGRSFSGLLPRPSAMAAEIPAYWDVYFAVTDITTAAATVTATGGIQLMPPTPIEIGTIAVFLDPFGAVFTLIQPDEHSTDKD